MSGYATADVASMLELPPRRVRDLARAGFLSPGRNPRGHYRFDFGDLVVLRTARDLLRSGIPFRRLCASLTNLRAKLPSGRPLTAVRIVADGKRVIVEDKDAVWDAESNQALLDFRVADLAEQVAPLAREIARQADNDELTLSSVDWFEVACDLELADPEQARAAYRRALRLDADHAGSHVNLGRLLHEVGDVEAAERHYRSALRVRPTDITALFNLGVALEDLGQLREALLAYREAVVADPDHADAHFNLAGVLERTGQKDRAVKHLKVYRQLIAGRGWDTDDRSV